MAKITTEKQFLDYIRKKGKHNKANITVLDYARIHSRRFAFLLQKLETLIPRDKEFKILELGSCFLSEIILQNHSNVTIDKHSFAPKDKGIEIEKVNKNRIGKKVLLDLNNLQTMDPDFDKYDLILMCEIIEHIYTSPYTIVKKLSLLLEDNGLLIIQTPNVASLSKRMTLLFGSNPLEMIKEDINNPGHFREYTIPELKDVAQKSGLEVISHSINNYLGRPKKFYDFICKHLPESFSDGITITLKKTTGGK